MRNFMRRTQFERWGRRAQAALIVGVSLGALSACDSLLEVELPHLLTDAAIEDEGTAELQINSAIALFECGYSSFGTMALGHEDAMQSIAGVYGGGHVYDATPNLGAECDSQSDENDWFDQIMGTRALISNAPSRLFTSSEGTSRGVYDRIQDDWSLGSAGERLSALGALYMTMALTHFGEFTCESSLDGSDLVGPTDMLNLAEAWSARALGHITTVGDFALPNAIAPSALDMTMAVRARLRWANGNLAGASADAAAVLASDPTFVAWITREAGITRRNKIYNNPTGVGFSGMLGRNFWWLPDTRLPNPATGNLWTQPIPFTGYLFLGIMPDGRTLDPGQVPISWAEETRPFGDTPTSLGNGAVPDTRVLHEKQPIQGPQPEEVPNKYGGESSDIPYMKWQELKLIQADYQFTLGGAANVLAAIGLVNDVRLGASPALPIVSGAYLATLTDGTNDANEVRWLIHEERKREFFAEGARYWSAKIQNTDIAWFPRRQGTTPFQGYNLQGGVRMLWATDEYLQNDFFVLNGGNDLRGSGCTSLGSIGGGPGAQAPVDAGGQPF